MKKLIISLFVLIISVVAYVYYPKPLDIPQTPDYSEGLEVVYTTCAKDTNPTIVIHHTAKIYESLSHMSSSQKQRLGKGNSRMIINGEDHENNIAYHYLVYANDDKIKTIQVLPDNAVGWNAGEMCTNLSSISIALMANYDEREPIDEEYEAINDILEEYPDHKVLVHKDVKATACPGKHFDTDRLTRYDGVVRETKSQEDGKEVIVSTYYTPDMNQDWYFRNTKGEWVGKFYPKNNIERKLAYEADFKVNCWGDCLSTASGKRLGLEQAMWALACPPEYPFGTKVTIDNRTMTCLDRGSAIINNKFDKWTGKGQEGANRIGQGAGKKYAIIKTP